MMVTKIQQNPTKGKRVKASDRTASQKTTREEEEAILEIVANICGKGAVVVIPILKDKPNIDEFKLASKAKITINELRNILYKLHHHDLVSFIRKKDKKKGWFIYYWTLNKEKALRSLKREYQKELETQQDILENTMKKNYFVCPRGHTELSQESALEQNFECVECGELLVLKDRESEKRRISKNIEALQVKVDKLHELLKKYERAREIRVEADRRRTKAARIRKRVGKKGVKKKKESVKEKIMSRKSYKNKGLKSKRLKIKKAKKLKQRLKQKLRKRRLKK